MKHFFQKERAVGRLSNAYLISTDDAGLCKQELEMFIAHDCGHEGISEVVDYLFLDNNANASKTIVLEQIRQMQHFLLHSSVITGKKYVLLSAPEHMNANAANACLKILEETPAKSHIFLISSNASRILPTIMSRCKKINIYYHRVEQSKGMAQASADDDWFLSVLSERADIHQHLEFLKELSKKESDLWSRFSVFCLDLMAKYVRQLAAPSWHLSPLEQEILHQLQIAGYANLPEMQLHYQKMSEFIDLSNKLELEKKSGAVLLMNYFKVNNSSSSLK
jgi:DNA polymerase-3 subunit delta'